jgi:hypothetical protein
MISPMQKVGPKAESLFGVNYEIPGGVIMNVANQKLKQSNW